MSTEFTRRLKAELNQTEHLNIYEVPCPDCGAVVTSTAKVMDDSVALSRCADGHEFTRAQAFEAYNASVRAQVRVNAVERLTVAKDVSNRFAYVPKLINARMLKLRNGIQIIVRAEKPSSDAIEKRIYKAVLSAAELSGMRLREFGSSEKGGIWTAYYKLMHE